MPQIAVMFKNQSLNSKYEIVEDAQIVILKIGFRGKVSEVPSEAALEDMIKRGSNLVKRKSSKERTDAAPPAAAKGPEATK